MSARGPGVTHMTPDLRTSPHGLRPRRAAETARTSAAPRRAGLRLALIALLASLATGCGGGGSGGGSVASAPPSGGGAPPPPAPQTDSQRFCSTAVHAHTPETPDDPPAYSVTIAAIERVGVPAIRESPCVLRGKVGGAGFRIVLPEHWNGELHFYGAEQFGGTVDTISAGDEQDLDGLPPAPGSMLVTTDGGHTGSSFVANWALNNERAIQDYAEDAVHAVLQVAVKEAVNRYGRVPKHRLFIGFDDGGRAGLIAAQRHPTDFDGIIAAAPRLNLTGQQVNALRIQQVREQPLWSPTMLSPAQRQALLATALDACDSDDGATDGVIANYHACHFDPGTLRCGSTATPAGSCLTDDQLVLIQATRSNAPAGYTQVDGVNRLPPFPVGYEGNYDWTLWINGEEIEEGVSAPYQFLFTEQFFRYFVAGDTDIDVLQLDVSQFADTLAQRSAQLDATHADLAAFAANGGKLILWHGTADYVVPLAGTAEYYERLRAAHPSPGAAGRPGTDSFVRFYVEPGSGHASQFQTTVPAYSPTRLITALRAWLDNDRPPPTQITITDIVDTDTGETITTHMCQYPSYPYTQAGGTVTCVDP